MEKIWDLEIQLTALLWNKSSSSPWPRCRQAAEPTATVGLEAGIRGGDQGTLEGSCQSGGHKCSPGRRCWLSSLERSPSVPLASPGQRSAGPVDRAEPRLRRRERTGGGRPWPRPAFCLQHLPQRQTRGRCPKPACWGEREQVPVLRG